MSTPIKAGDELEIIPEWRDKGDEKYQWFAVEDEDPIDGRLLIKCVGTSLFIAPTQIVHSYMVRKKKK